MFPTIIELGPLTIRTYGLMVAAGLFVALKYILAQCQKRNITEEIATDMVLYAMVSGLIGARITYVLTNLNYYLLNPADIFRIWEGGLVFHGGFIAGLIAVIIYTRINKAIDIWQIADISAPALSLGHAFGRLGCLSAGCCYGAHSDLPWAIRFSNKACLAPTGVYLHPTQLYELFGNLVIFVVLHMLLGKARIKGIVVSVYLFLYGILRFSVEFFRGDERGAMIAGLSHAQVFSIVMIIAGACIYVLIAGKAHCQSPNTMAKQ